MWMADPSMAIGESDKASRVHQPPAHVVAFRTAKRLIENQFMYFVGFWVQKACPSGFQLPPGDNCTLRGELRQQDRHPGGRRGPHLEGQP